MLKRENRISSLELSKLKIGVNLKTPLFNVKKYKSLKNKSLLIVSKKNLKNASKRNLLRRRVYFAFNKIQGKESADIFSLKKENIVKGKTSEEVIGEIEKKIEANATVLYYMLKDSEQKVPKYSIIEKQIKKICGIQ